MSDDNEWQRKSGTNPPAPPGPRPPPPPPPPPVPNVLGNLEGQWQKLLTLVIFKLMGEGVSVVIFPEDIELMGAIFKDRGGPVLVTHGHLNAIEYKVMSQVDVEMMVMKRADRNIQRRQV